MCHSDQVVSYRNSTSNHNCFSDVNCVIELYLIEILHQTTTSGTAGNQRRLLYLIEILHQTTTSLALASSSSTLYLIEILHQTTTRRYSFSLLGCCILSKFYIKPQQLPLQRYPIGVVSYRNSTSNHNYHIALGS